MSDGQQPIRTAIVLVGGRGSRLGSLTEFVPKPLLPVAGRPFLDWLIEALQRAGVQSFVLSAGHRAEAIEEYAERARSRGLDVSVSRESRPLGTGGAIVAATEHCNSSAPVLVVNGDSLLAADLGDLQTRLEPSADALVVATHVADAGRFGSILLKPDGSLSALAEKSSMSDLVNAGVYVFRPRLISSFPLTRPLSLEREVIPYLLAGGSRISVIPIDAPFIDIGVPESLVAAERFVTEHLAPRV